MVEIEFFDPEDVPVPPDGGEEIGREPARTARFDTGRLTAGALLLGAAVLAVVAPFQQVYVVRATRAEPAFLLSADGWGRVTGGDLSPVRPGFHESRYGIALAVGAGLLAFHLLVLVAHWAGSAIAGRILPAARAAAVAATGLMAGLLAAMWLAVDSRFAGYRSTFETDAAGPPPLDLGYGACLWLVAAAAVAAALGLLAVWRRGAPPSSAERHVGRHG